MSFQGLLLQQDQGDYGWGGSSQRLREDESCFNGALTVNVNNYSAESLFSPSDLFSPQQQQQQQQQPVIDWQSSGYRRGDHGVGEVLHHHDQSSGSDGVISEGEAAKVEWTSNYVEKESWRKFGDFSVGDVKQEEYENIIQEPIYVLEDGIQLRKRHLSEAVPGSGSSSDSDSDVSEMRKRKRKKPGQDADGNVTWTDESVRFLFETYDAIHQRLWEESKGQVKYQKKWTPILRAMQTRFGNHFTKKQCQSKYWSVRRECTEYRLMSTKAAATDPMWNPSIAGRELLKPKFYDVWLHVSGKNQAMVLTTKTKTSSVVNVYPGELLKSKPSSARALGKDGLPVRQRTKSDLDRTSIQEMQRLMVVELQASEKREEAMKYRAELIMDLLTQHIEHVENRVNTIDESRNPQLHLLERVNLKLEKVLDGLSALNQHLSKLHTEH